MKRFLPLLLAVALLIPCLLTGCKQTETSPETTTPETTTPEVTTPEDNTPKFPPEGAIKLTTATISTGNTPAEQTAANDLKKYLTQKGVNIKDEGGFPITLSIDESLGDDAFRVTAVVGENKSESLAIVGGNGRGVLYGAYQFLEKCAEVRFFTPELEVCNPGDVYVWDGVLLDVTPVFEMRQIDWYNWMDETTRHTWAAKVGINIMSGWRPSWDESLGGSLCYAPSLFVHTLGKLSEYNTANDPNPCLTDEAIYNKVLENLRKVLEENPGTKIVSVSQNDKKAHCKCENCQAILAEEGNPSGILLRFVNRIAAELAPDYPDLMIETLAYQYSLQAPKVTKAAPNVRIRVCSIDCHFNHPLTKLDCKACTKFRTAINDWNAICDSVYVWDYTTNYSYYLATFPNFHVLQKNMLYFANSNVKGIYEQGNGSSPSGEFGELRAYLLAKLMMNPYMTEEEYNTHRNEFLAAYYGAGWENILKYINQFTRYANSSSSGMGIYSNPFTVISKSAFGDMEKTFNQWWDVAEAAAGDRLEYVQRSRWQVRYMSLFVNPNKDKAQQLIKEVEENGTYWSERFKTLLWYVYDERFSLLEKSPETWFTDPSPKKE